MTANRLLRSLRVSIVDDDLLTGVHMRIYGGGMDRDAIAVVLPAAINEGVVYSRGVEASQTHKSLQARVLPFGREPVMIGTGGTMKSSAREELQAGVYEQFEEYESIARQTMGCCK